MYIRTCRSSRNYPLHRLTACASICLYMEEAGVRGSRLGFNYLVEGGGPVRQATHKARDTLIHLTGTNSVQDDIKNTLTDSILPQVGRGLVRGHAVPLYACTHTCTSSQALSRSLSLSFLWLLLRHIMSNVQKF